MAVLSLCLLTLALFLLVEIIGRGVFAGMHRQVSHKAHVQWVANHLVGVFVLITAVATYYTQGRTIFLIWLPLLLWGIRSLAHKPTAHILAKSLKFSAAALVAQLVILLLNYYYWQSTHFAWGTSDSQSYSVIAEGLVRTGQESYLAVLSEINTQFAGMLPYHHYELWLGGWLAHVSGIPTLIVLSVVVFSYLLLLTLGSLLSCCSVHAFPKFALATASLFVLPINLGELLDIAFLQNAYSNYHITTTLKAVALAPTLIFAVRVFRQHIVFAGILLLLAGILNPILAPALACTVGAVWLLNRRSIPRRALQICAGLLLLTLAATVALYLSLKPEYPVVSAGGTTLMQILLSMIKRLLALPLINVLYFLPLALSFVVVLLSYKQKKEVLKNGINHPVFWLLVFSFFFAGLFKEISRESIQVVRLTIAVLAPAAFLVLWTKALALQPQSRRVVWALLVVQVLFSGYQLTSQYSPRSPITTYSLHNAPSWMLCFFTEQELYLAEQPNVRPLYDAGLPISAHISNVIPVAIELENVQVQDTLRYQKFRPFLFPFSTFLDAQPHTLSVKQGLAALEEKYPIRYVYVSDGASPPDGLLGSLALDAHYGKIYHYQP